VLAVSGTPGAYEPPLSPADRPRNLAELDQRVTVASPEPWPANAYVLIGTTGRRAHWTGTGWKGGESPGYSSTVTIGAVRSATERTGDAER
jgi:hypothetical protein